MNPELLKSYKRLNRLRDNESVEPLVGWGFRMALSGTLPIVWGVVTGRMNDAIWITLTAEAVSWVEMKGAFAWRVRTLFAGSLLAIISAMLGSAVGANMWLCLPLMFGIAFVATLLKNIGDRASGLALCAYMLFIFCNAYPVTSLGQLPHRLLLLAIGATWPVAVGLLISYLTPVEQPFRRQISLIWRSIGALTATIAEQAGQQNNTTLVYEEEKDVRKAMDNSYQFYGQMAHQVSRKDEQQRQLSLLRKIAGMVSVNALAMNEELGRLGMSDGDDLLPVKMATLLGALREAINRIAAYVATLEGEEKLLASTHINRMKKLGALIAQLPPPKDERQSKALSRLLQLSGRTVKLLENALLRIEQMGTDAPAFKSYSFIKTLFILNPRYLFSDLRMALHPDSFNTRYALRSAVAATLAMFIYREFDVDHGYWIPFSLMIVIQPYFGATLTRAVDRVVGTVLGGLAGSLLLHLPTGLYLKEAVLFLTFILMVVYIRKKYAIAVFFITLNLVLLFHIESAYNDKIMLYRALCTVCGSLLAVASGFALFPTWDKKWLPGHLAEAIKCNYSYFTATFFADKRNVNWTRDKRNAETKNSNVFDSFNRYVQEPGAEQSGLFYELITSNVRITRHLNNIQLEEDEKKTGSAASPSPRQQSKINECLQWFRQVLTRLALLTPEPETPAGLGTHEEHSPFSLNEAQMVALEKLIIELKTADSILAQLKGKS